VRGIYALGICTMAPSGRAWDVGRQVGWERRLGAIAQGQLMGPFENTIGWL